MPESVSVEKQDGCGKLQTVSRLEILLRALQASLSRLRLKNEWDSHSSFVRFFDCVERVKLRSVECRSCCLTASYQA